MPIVVVQQVIPKTSPIFAKGSNGYALHEVATSRNYDHHVERALPSAFVGTDLAEWLETHAIDTIVIIGYVTQNCDESTSRDVLYRGLTVEFLSGATGTLAMANHQGSLGAEELHRVVLVVLQSCFAAVSTTREWVDAAPNGMDLEMSNVVASTVIARS